MWQVSIFIAIAIIITIIFEALPTGVLNRWQYGEAMPTLPVLGTGLLPVLQWLIIPLLITDITHLLICEDRRLENYFWGIGIGKQTTLFLFFKL